MRRLVVFLSVSFHRALYVASLRLLQEVARRFIPRFYYDGPFTRAVEGGGSSTAKHKTRTTPDISNVGGSGRNFLDTSPILMSPSGAMKPGHDTAAAALGRGGEFDLSEVKVRNACDDIGKARKYRHSARSSNILR